MGTHRDTFGLLGGVLTGALARVLGGGGDTQRYSLAGVAAAHADPAVGQDHREVPCGGAGLPSSSPGVLEGYSRRSPEVLEKYHVARKDSKDKHTPTAHTRTHAHTHTALGRWGPSSCRRKYSEYPA